MQRTAVSFQRKRSSSRPIAGERRRKKASAPVPCKGRVLLMDDEDLICEIVSEMLGECGYQVTASCDGVGSIESFKQAKELQKPFDAVILDLNIPAGMQGLDVFERLRSIDPGVRAVVLTGDINHQLVTRYKECGFRSILIKPFMRAELLLALEGALA